jgi:hypothetical protein
MQAPDGATDPSPWRKPLERASSARTQAPDGAKGDPESALGTISASVVPTGLGFVRRIAVPWLAPWARFFRRCRGWLARISRILVRGSLLGRTKRGASEPCVDKAQIIGPAHPCASIRGRKQRTDCISGPRSAHGWRHTDQDMHSWLACGMGSRTPASSSVDLQCKPRTGRQILAHGASRGNGHRPRAPEPRTGRKTIRNRRWAQYRRLSSLRDWGSFAGSPSHGSRHGLDSVAAAAADLLAWISRSAGVSFLPQRPFPYSYTYSYTRISSACKSGIGVYE